MTDSNLQARAARLVEREVHACMTSLVSTLAKAGGGAIASRKGGNPYLDPTVSDLMHMADQAMELAAPVLDYEGAAKEPDEDGLTWTDEAMAAAGFPDWEDVCRHDGIEPHEMEVYEHWAVSSWLAEKLAAKGERVDTDFAGLNIWARTTTGQAIHADAVIGAIVTETGYAGGVA